MSGCHENRGSLGEWLGPTHSLRLRLIPHSVQTWPGKVIHICEQVMRGQPYNKIGETGISLLHDGAIENIT